MSRGRCSHPSEQRTGAWFAHVGVCQDKPESTTTSALKQVQNSGAAQYVEDRLPLAYRTREQRAVNNNFPFSSHDNRHCLQNVGEYFDFLIFEPDSIPLPFEDSIQYFYQLFFFPPKRSRRLKAALPLLLRLLLKHQIT
uniref:Domain of unknown function with conserved HDNR motif domain-containing protein n=1 Tax=Buteo japonicus TaxID=224669 RepID=A0A8C0BRF2_9AVES